jgi:hypothetical protein
MAEYEVLSSVLERQADFGDNRMNLFITTLKPTAGGDILTGVQVWRNVKYEPVVEGETWTGELENASRGDGLKLAKPRLVGSGGSSSSSAGGSAGAPPRQSRTDATGRSIERQVALKAAVEWAGPNTTSTEVLAAATAFDNWLKGEQPEDKPDEPLKDGEEIPF